MRSFDYKAKRAAAVTSQNTTDAFLFVRADDSTKNCQVIVPAGTKSFRVRAFGTATGGTTTNFTAKFFWGDAVTTVLAASNAAAVNSASGGWMLEATVALDTVNSKLHGLTQGYCGSTPTVNAGTIITDLTSQTQTTVNTKIVTVGGVFSAADAGNKATLDGFTLEVLDQAP